MKIINIRKKMPFRTKSFPIRFSKAIDVQKNVVQYWERFIVKGQTNLSRFMYEIMEVMATLKPDVLIALIVNCSFVAKIRHISYLISFWSNYYGLKCGKYLLDGTFSAKKPFIIGFAAFLQLCRIRRNQKEELTSEQICIIEELKTELQLSIFDNDVLIELIRRQQVRESTMFSWDIPDFVIRFGWFIFAKHFNDIGEFDPIKFPIEG